TPPPPPLRKASRVARRRLASAGGRRPRRAGHLRAPCGPHPSAAGRRGGGAEGVLRAMSGFLSFPSDSSDDSEEYDEESMAGPEALLFKALGWPTAPPNDAARHRGA